VMAFKATIGLVFVANCFVNPIQEG
jgi:hypothetical protein